MLSKVIFLVTIIILGWMIYTGILPIYPKPQIKIDTGISGFLRLEGANEYVITKLITSEEFTATKIGLIVTNVKISLVAHYKYYVIPHEVKHHVENDVIFLHIPKLYLSTPVAFDSSTLRVNCDGLLGLGCKDTFEQLKENISRELESKGKSQIGVVYDTAAKALADNLNEYLTKNGYGHNYKSIVVSFVIEDSRSQRRFDYNNSACSDKEPCPLDFNLGKTQKQIVN